MNLLCFLGFHKWRTQTIWSSPDFKEFLEGRKCIHCLTIHPKDNEQARRLENVRHSLKYMRPLL